MNDPIFFYGRTDEFYEFSNFSPHGFETEVGYWPTVEHYFQAQKFIGDEHRVYRETIRTARRPKTPRTSAKPAVSLSDPTGTTSRTT